jgi:hypothetical protein
VRSIRLFGTTDNTNTEFFERLHIDFAKDAWNASNRRDALPQMIEWLKRKEKVDQFECFLEWKQRVVTARARRFRGSHMKTVSGMSIFMAKSPPSPRQRISDLEVAHHARYFSDDLKVFIQDVCSRDPNVVRRLALDTGMINGLKNERVDVWHRLKLIHPDIQEIADIETEDYIIASPKARRFDTVILQKDNSEGAEKVALRNAQVARVRIIFRIPERLRRIDPSLPSEPLLYVHRFHAPRNVADSATKMYQVRKLTYANGPAEWSGYPCGEVVSIQSVRHSCHLFPAPKHTQSNKHWTSANVLDNCDAFYINNWVNHHVYHSVH